MTCSTTRNRARALAVLGVVALATGCAHPAAGPADPDVVQGVVVRAHGDLWISHACGAGVCRDLLVEGDAALAELEGRRVRLRVARIDPCREGLMDSALAGHTGLRVLAVEAA